MTNEVSVGGGFNPMSLMPKTFNEKYQMAGILSKSGLLPQGLNTPEKVCVALEWGAELQLPPMVAVNNIAVIKGKPTLSADIMSAVVKRSPDYGGTEWIELSDQAAECVVTRRGNGYEEKTRSRFTMQDAVRAGLTNNLVWKSYPKRMLKHRCLSYALRDAFPDILAGIYEPDEMENVDSGAYTNTEQVAESVKTVNEEPKKQEMKHFDKAEAAEARPAEQPGVEPVPDTHFNADKAEYVNPTETKQDDFGNLLKTYEKQLDKHYSMAYSVYKSGNDAEKQAMYTRCVTYLGRKGIKVA